MQNQTVYEPPRGLADKITRRVVQWRNAAPANIRPPRPVLTLTFDDCPKSAITLGGPLLDEYQVRGAYYIATGMLDTDTPMGRIASADDVRTIHEDGHEICAHTHSHIDCARSDISEVEDDLNRNLNALDKITHGAKIHSFAYPFGETSFELKTRLKSQFSTLRGILPGVNRGLVDRSQLRAYEIDGSEKSVADLISAIDRSVISPEWTIMFTHDVSETPSGFGITPDQLRRVLDHARAHNVDIMTPSQAAQSLGMIAA